MRRKMSVSSGRTHHLGIRRERRAGPRSCAWCAALSAIVVLGGLAGCGTNIEAVLAQTGNAAATTLFDALLTDFANSVADNLDQNAPRPVDGADGDGGDGGDDGDGGDNGGSPGQQAYTDRGCGGCHGTDGEGGSAPALAGVDQTDALEARFGGGADHFGSTLSDQEIADITAWLLGDEGGDGVDGGLDGTAMFADDCAACHGDDGASGFAPDITGVDAAALSTGLESGAHSGIALTAEEVAAIAEFLGG